MKKILRVILPVLLALVLVSCGKKENKVVISKLITASNIDNNIIELYNNSDKDVKLDKYTIDFYNNGSESVENQIKLNGSIKANSYFVIAGGKIESQHENLVDYKHTENLSFNGDDAIALSTKGKIIDVVGTIGIDVFYSRGLSLIRLGDKKDFAPSDTFDSLNFISYTTDMFKYIKNDNHEIKTWADLLKGPRLEQRYKEMTYAVENTSGSVKLGNGGAFKVTLRSIADGDTATFNPVGDIPEGYSNGNSVRYYYINTPEVNGGNVVAEPWGYVASKLNKEYILNNSTSKELHVQSIPLENTTETHGRNLGLVWINDELSQFITVAEGLSETVQVTYNPGDLLLTYKDIPYLTFLRFAEENARRNLWGLFGYPTNPNGEVAPDWDYQNNRNKTTNPEWVPHNNNILG